MSEFQEGSLFARNVAKEMMITLVMFGLDVNYTNKEGFSPLMVAVKGKLKSL